MDNNWKTIEKGTHRGLLDGTIVNHECDPREDCPECHGTGKCTQCQGSGEVDCHECHGSGKCQDCRGEGSTRCLECHGSGECRHCHGDGQILCRDCHGNGVIWQNGRSIKCKTCGGGGYAPCPECSSIGQKAVRGLLWTSNDARGSGRCPKCGGTGELVCKTCDGTGLCTSCNGSGKETCSHCDGTGSCPNCNGTGKITCRRCEGSGWYQTFSIYNSRFYEKDWGYVSNSDLKDGITLATKRPVYKDIYLKWKYKDVLEFDKKDELKQKVKQDFGNDDAFKNFDDSYQQALKESDANDTPCENFVEIEKVPMTKVDFTLNGKEYSVYVMGDNGVVMCEDLPAKIEMYKTSFFQKIMMLFTKKKRHLSYIKLAAYIFQCDGKDMNESHVLDVFVSALKLQPEKQDILKEQLKMYNSDMPYETFRKEIKTLFSSKKTLTFAWQCMAVDKKLSQQENDLFDKLVAEYEIEPTEVESMKRFASKYSLLENENLVSEYLSK